jgi:hypothetical protein
VPGQAERPYLSNAGPVEQAADDEPDAAVPIALDDVRVHVDPPARPDHDLAGLAVGLYLLCRLIRQREPLRRRWDEGDPGGDEERRNEPRRVVPGDEKERRLRLGECERKLNELEERQFGAKGLAGRDGLLSARSLGAGGGCSVITDLGDGPRRAVATDVREIEILDDALTDRHQANRVVLGQRGENGRARLDVERDRAIVEIERGRDVGIGRIVRLAICQSGRDVELERLVVWLGRRQISARQSGIA